LRELYLYWKLPADRAAVALPALRAWQRTLCAEHPPLQARLLRRADAGAAGLQTWMEVYQAPGDGIGAALQQRIRAEGDALLHAVQPCLQRVLEVFEAGADAPPAG
jgi:hypothetical protein